MSTVIWNCSGKIEEIFYEVTNYKTGESRVIKAQSVIEAHEKSGWDLDNCSVTKIKP